MTFNPQELDWEDLHKQLQLNPDRQIRKIISDEMLRRVWDGPEQPENRIPARVFDPSW